MSTLPLPIAVLISGNGSNLQALIDATRRDDIGYEIAVVVSDRSGVQGLERATSAGLEAVVVDWSEFNTRVAFTEAVCDVVQRYGATAMVLAGFMRILDRVAIERFPDAIINVHPSLLPSFPGARAVHEALQHGVRLTGVTVHFVDEKVDHGPIISQEAIEVFPDDNVEILHRRIRRTEHRVLPEAVAAFARGDFRVEGRHVRWQQSLQEKRSNDTD